MGLVNTPALETDATFFFKALKRYSETFIFMNSLI